MIKPDYRPLTMAEVNEATPNGLKVASTFTGAGGSCLGLRLAGWDVLWGSEFVEAARDTYLANYPTAVLDPRDIRDVTPAEVRAGAGLAEEEELDLLEGSPPCSAFSMSGSRDAGWGTVSDYSDTEQRTDDLFFEFIRLLGGLQPRAFIAENVPGLVTGVAKGYFKQIFREMVDQGYRVEARVLDGQWLGVPQSRRRLFFQGVREDVTDSQGEPVTPAWPVPNGWSYALSEVAESFRGRVIHDNAGWVTNRVIQDNEPIPTITVGPNSLNSRHYQICDDGITEDPETGETISIDGYAIGRVAPMLDEGEGAGGNTAIYQNLTRAHRGKPSPTVTVTAGVIGAAGVLHPTGRRKFTLRELRLVQGFPEDFILTGNYRQRWERVARSVPPPMSAALSGAVAEALNR